jgi:hypothetical protein
MVLENTTSFSCRLLHFTLVWNVSRSIGVGGFHRLLSGISVRVVCAEHSMHSGTNLERE